MRPFPSVAGQVPLYVGPAGKGFVAVRTLELRFNLMLLPVQGARQQGVEALVALVAGVLLAGDVRPLVLRQLGGRLETLAADGADVRQPAVLRVSPLVVDGQRAQVSKGAPTQLAGEGNGRALMFALVLGQVPRVLEGSLAERAVKRSLSGVGELMPPHVRASGERLTTRFARQRLLPARGLGQVEFASTVRLFRLVLSCFAVLRVSHREKFN